VSALGAHPDVLARRTVFPSLYESSSLQGFRDAAAFDPERFFSEERREDVAFRRNLLVFGAGAHQCVGQRYELNHLVLFLALFVSLVDFRAARHGRVRRPGRVHPHHHAQGRLRRVPQAPILLS